LNWSAALVALVCPATVTVTSTGPTPAGLVALQVVVLAQLTAVPAAGPKRTAVPPEAVLKLVPLIVTTVPPAAGPLVGLIPLTVGGGGAVWLVLTVTSSKSLVPTASFQSWNR